MIAYLFPTLLMLAGPTWSEPEEVEILTLTSIDYKEGEELPDEVKDLDGKHIKIEGFFDNDTSEGSTTFLLVNDGCGCEGSPKIHHFIEVTLESGTTGYRPDRVTVVGTLSVGEVKEDGYVVSLYRLSAESVK